MARSKHEATTKLVRAKSMCIGVEEKLALGNMEVNTGNYQVAIDWFSEILDNDSDCCAAYVGRGSALALMQLQDQAVRDFTRAIDIDDTQAEAFKRRGQV